MTFYVGLFFYFTICLRFRRSKFMPRALDLVLHLKIIFFFFIGTLGKIYHDGKFRRFLAFDNRQRLSNVANRSVVD